MKLNFKYVSMMLCTALLAGFTSCSNNDDEVNAPEIDLNGTHSVTLSTKILGGSTRAEAESAVGVVPNCGDLTFLFVGDGEILKIYSTTDIDEATTTGKTITGIPNAISNAVYVIANASSLSDTQLESAINTLVEGETEKNLVTQIRFTTDQTASLNNNPRNVILQGYTAYTPIATGNTVINIDIVPALSRIEIASVAGKTVAEDAIEVENEVNTFDFDGIYINNTFKHLGMDYKDHADAGVDFHHINYGKEHEFWTNGSYDPNFCDFLTLTGGNKYVPTMIDNFWGYYVLPAATTADDGTLCGTVIDGALRSAVPMITCALSNVVVNSGTPIADARYVTVTKYKDQNGTYINKFEPGKVYQIATIKFDATNLSEYPVPDPTDTHDVIATVIVKPWEGINTTPEL